MKKPRISPSQLLRGIFVLTRESGPVTVARLAGHFGVAPARLESPLATLRRQGCLSATTRPNLTMLGLMGAAALLSECELEGETRPTSRAA